MKIFKITFLSLFFSFSNVSDCLGNSLTAFKEDIPIWDQFEILECYTLKELTCNQDTCRNENLSRYFELNFRKNEYNPKGLSVNFSMPIVKKTFHKKDKIYLSTMNEIIVGEGIHFKFYYLPQTLRNIEKPKFDYSALQFLHGEIKSPQDLGNILRNDGYCFPN